MVYGITLLNSTPWIT